MLYLWLFVQEWSTLMSILRACCFADSDSPFQMQDVIRTTGAAYMSERDYNVFVKTHADGKLVDPEDCGHVIASLSLQASKNLSGQFISWDSEECKAYRKHC